jgi:hypothetical protein
MSHVCRSASDLLARALGSAAVTVLLAAGAVLGATPLVVGLLVTGTVPGLGALAYDNPWSLVVRLAGVLCGTVMAEDIGQRLADRHLLIRTPLTGRAARIGASVVSAGCGLVVGAELLAPVMENVWRAVATMAVADALSIPFAGLLSFGGDGQT